jgi:hypothetical protein
MYSKNGLHLPNNTMATSIVLVAIMDGWNSFFNTKEPVFGWEGDSYKFTSNMRKNLSNQKKKNKHTNENGN